MEKPMEYRNWTWLVAHGAYRDSVCIGRDNLLDIAKFKAKHEQYEVFVRPFGYHWDGKPC